MADDKGRVRFIRKGGRVIPIRAKKGQRKRKKENPWGKRYGVAAAAGFGYNIKKVAKAKIPLPHGWTKALKRLTPRSKHKLGGVLAAGIGAGALIGSGLSYASYRLNEGLYRGVTGQEKKDRQPLGFKKYLGIAAVTAAGALLAPKAVRFIKGSGKLKRLTSTLKKRSWKPIKAKSRRL